MISYRVAVGAEFVDNDRFIGWASVLNLLIIIGSLMITDVFAAGFKLCCCAILCIVKYYAIASYIILYYVIFHNVIL